MDLTLPAAEVAAIQEKLAADLRLDLAEARAQVAELQEEASKNERAHLSTIDERDAADDWFAKVAGLLGVDTEFSNVRGYVDVHDDCEAAIQALRESAVLPAAVGGQPPCEKGSDL